MKKRGGLLLTMILGTAMFINAQFFPVDTLKLNRAYEDLVNNMNTLERQKAFFDAFPNTWMEFTMTYQYIGGGNYDLRMYDLAEKHIKAFFYRVNSIPDSVYFRKIIGITIGADWNVGAPGYFQEMIRKEIWISDSMDSMFETIGTFSKAYQMQFWQFYWSGTHADRIIKRDFERLRKLNADVYPEQVKIMEIAFEYFYGGVDIRENFTFIK